MTILPGQPAVKLRDSLPAIDVPPVATVPVIVPLYVKPLRLPLPVPLKVPVGEPGLSSRAAEHWPGV